MDMRFACCAATLAAGFSSAAFGGEITFDIGSGNVTNVTESIPYDVTGVTVRSGTANLLSAWNYFTGDLSVEGGALGFAKLRPGGEPSSFGRTAATVALAGGTTLSGRGAGDLGTSDAGLTLGTAGSDAATTVDAQGDFAFAGPMRSLGGAFVKTGPGTFTVATREPTAGETNRLSRSVAGGRSLDVREGTLAIATGSSVTNLVGGETLDAKSAVYIGSAGKTASLDQCGGQTFFPRFLYVGGNSMKAALNVRGGSLSAVDRNNSTIYIGNGFTAADASHEDAALNVFGGSVWSQYYQLAPDKKTKGKLLVAGGTMSGYGLYIAHTTGGSSLADTENLPYGEIHVCSNGVLNMSTIVLSRSAYSRSLVRVTDGGTLYLNQGFVINSYETDGTLELDGGTVIFNRDKNDDNVMTPACVTTKVGAQRSTITLGRQWKYLVNGPVVSGVEDGEDGGLLINGGKGSVSFNDAVTCTGPVTLAPATPIRLHGRDLALAKLAAEDEDISLVYGYADGHMPLLTLGGLDVPGLVTVTFEGSVPAGTYDIVSVPTASGLAAEKFLCSSATDASGAVFSARTSGDRTVISVTLAARTVATSLWTQPAGGDWATAGNWDVAPVSKSETRVSFNAASAAAGTAVTLDAPFTLGGMSFAANPGYAVSGATITLDNFGQCAKVSATAGSNEIAAPLAVNGFAEISAAAGATLKVSGAVSGGKVTVNPATSGSGTVVLSGASTFASAFKVNSGKASVTSVADRGIASPAGAGGEIVIGKGTFEFAGGEGSTDRTVTFFGDGQRYFSGALGVADGSTLTLTGLVENPFGGFHKTGKGTLVLSGAHDYAFGRTCGNYGVRNTSDYVSSTDDATHSLFAAMIGAGRTVWGEPGQGVDVTGSLAIGTTTTLAAGKETDAELVINGGTTKATAIYVGQDHGTAATAEHAVLTNRLVVNGGQVTCETLDIGAQTYRSSAQFSELVVNGGALTVKNYTGIGYQGDANHLSKTRVVLNGGALNTRGVLYVGPQENPPEIAIEINDGGLFDSDAGFRFSWLNKTGVPHRLTVNEGGVFRPAGQVSQGDASCGIIVFDGGTYQPKGASATINREVNIGLTEKGMVLDTSAVHPDKAAQVMGRIGTAEGVAADGGLVIRGPKALNRAIQFTVADDLLFNGPVSVEEGGVALALGAAMSGKTVTVAKGGAFGTYHASSSGSESTVSSLTLEDGATVVVGVNGTLSHGMPRATSELVQKGQVLVMMTPYSTSFPLNTTAGTYAVLRGPKGSLDATKFALSPRYAATTEATFSLNTENAGYDEVKMKISNASAVIVDPETTVHTWTAPGGGAWTSPANWDAAPADATDDAIAIPATVATPATITLGGTRTFAALTSAAAGEVTLTGGTLTPKCDGANPKIRTTSGTLVLPDMVSPSTSALAVKLDVLAGSTQVLAGVVSAETRLYANQIPGRNGGTIRFAHPQSFYLQNESGTVEGSAEALNDSTVESHNATVAFTAGGESRATVVGMDGLNLRTDEDVYFLRKVSNNGPFVKTGKGTAYLLSTESQTLAGNTRSPGDGATVPWQMPANGDLPTSGLDYGNIAGGTLVCGLTGGEVKFGGRVRVGCNIADFDENGDINDAAIEVRGGKFTISGDLNIARNCGLYRTLGADTPSRLDASFSVYDGEVSFGGLYMCNNDGSGGAMNSTASLNLYGGSVKSTGSYVFLNGARTSKMTDKGLSHSYINVCGGVFTNTCFKEASKDTNGGLDTTPIGSGNLDVNLVKGDFAWASALHCSANNASTQVRFNFAGGRLVTRYLRRMNGTGSFDLYWNGGIYRPTLDKSTLKGQTPSLDAGSDWTSNVCSTNGANFEIPAGNVFTLDQALTHDADLADVADGGLASVGEGTLVLGAANSFTGPVKALAGTIRVDADGAIPASSPLVIGGGAVDLNGHALTFGDVLFRNGVWPVTGGEVTVGGCILAASGVAGASIPMGAGVIFAPGALFRPQIGYDPQTGRWSSDFLSFAGGATGLVTVDLGHDAENPLPKGFQVKIAEFPSGTASFPRFKIVNWGDERRTDAVVKFVTAESGAIEVWVRITGLGAVLIVR